MVTSIFRDTCIFIFLNLMFVRSHCIHDNMCNLPYIYSDEIALLKVASDSTLTVVKTVSTSFRCFSISLLDTDTFLVGTWNHPKPVRTITIRGTEGELSNASVPNKTYGPDKSTCTYIPSTKTMVLADREDNSVYMCSTETSECRKVTDDRIRLPHGVCGGPGGTAIVCCNESDTIVQLSPQGCVMMEQSVGMLAPRAVSVSRDGSHMVVSNVHKDNTKIKLFRLVCS